MRTSIAKTQHDGELEVDSPSTMVRAASTFFNRWPTLSTSLKQDRKASSASRCHPEHYAEAAQHDDTLQAEQCGPVPRHKVLDLALHGIEEEALALELAATQQPGVRPKA